MVSPPSHDYPFCFSSVQFNSVRKTLIIPQGAILLSCGSFCGGSPLRNIHSVFLCPLFLWWVPPLKTIHSVPVVSPPSEDSPLCVPVVSPPSEDSPLCVLWWVPIPPLRTLHSVFLWWVLPLRTLHSVFLWWAPPLRTTHSVLVVSSPLWGLSTLCSCCESPSGMTHDKYTGYIVSFQVKFNKPANKYLLTCFRWLWPIQQCLHQPVIWPRGWWLSLWANGESWRWIYRWLIWLCALVLCGGVMCTMILTATQWLPW